MKKTYKEFQEQVLEKTLSPEDFDDLIDKSIEGVTAIKNDKKRNKEDVSTAKSVLKWLQGVRATFEKEGSLHPSTVLSIMKTVAGVSSGRYGYMVPGWKSSPQGKVPKDFSNEELNEGKGMSDTVIKTGALMTKRYIINKGAEGDVSAQLNGLASLILFAIASTDRGESFMSKALATSGFFKGASKK